MALLRRARGPARGARPRTEGCGDLPAVAQRVYGGLPARIDRAPRVQQRTGGPEKGAAPAPDPPRLGASAPAACAASPASRCSSSRPRGPGSRDVIRRAHHIAAFDLEHRKAYAASFVESIVFWGVLLYAASRRAGGAAPSPALVFVVLFTLAMGVEGGFHAFYNIYLSMDGQIHTKSFGWSIVGTLPLTRPVVAGHTSSPRRVAALLIHQGRRLLRARGWRWWRPWACRPAVLYAVCTIPVSYRTLQSTLFDMIYFHGIGAIARETLGYTHDSPDLRVQKRSPEPVPKPHGPPGATAQRALHPAGEPARRRHVHRVRPRRASSPRASPTRSSPTGSRSSSSAATPPPPPSPISNLWSGVRPTEGRESCTRSPSSGTTRTPPATTPPTGRART